MPATKNAIPTRENAKAAAPGTMLVPEKLAPLVHYLRHEKVILDSDLAELYGVTTGTLNQAVQRNIDRFPADFMFQLTENETETLRSQFVTASSDPASLRSQIVIAKNAELSLPCQSGKANSRGGRRTLP
ncbi:MAG: ORF6N domain-containing protein, partial [Verrucomicrobia bacterium]|nr:ORF6N domain-containing protein [Verrucomicrobiota bacterium]